MFRRRRTYLDWAAAAPVSSVAARAYARAARAYGNPSSPHAEGRAAREILEGARVAVARAVGAKADDIIFTSGATESNNLAIRGIVGSRRKAAGSSEKTHILYLPSAHASIVETVKSLEREGVLAAEPLVIKSGEVDMEALEKQIRPETALVAMDRVCSETGTIWNTREVSNVLRQAQDKRILLHVDASQSPLEESVEKTRLGADTMTLDAQKIGGMRGLGILIAPRAVPLLSLMSGGGQERTVRSGTPAPALAAAFAAALVETGKNRSVFAARALRERAELVEALSQIPDAIVNQGKRGIAHILNISLLNRDTDYLVALMDEAGFAVSTRSACESDSGDGSRAVFALANDAGRAKSTFRISWGPGVKTAELRRFAHALAREVHFLDGMVYSKA